jgi:hypothetical protein
MYRRHSNRTCGEQLIASIRRHNSGQIACSQHASTSSDVFPDGWGGVFPSPVRHIPFLRVRDNFWTSAYFFSIRTPKQDVAPAVAFG